MFGRAIQSISDPDTTRVWVNPRITMPILRRCLRRGWLRPYITKVVMSVHNSSTVLLDPEDVSVAFGISLLSGI